MDNWISIDDCQPKHGTNIIAAVYDEFCEYYEIMILLVAKRGKKNVYYTECYEKIKNNKSPMTIRDVGKINNELVKAWMPIPKFKG